MNQYVKSDLYRYCGNTSWKSFISAYLRIRSFRFQVAFRLVNASGFHKILGKVLWLIRDRSIDIPKETKIGYGLYIGHGYIVVNRTAVIGNNVNLSQYTTIGSNSNHAAHIGDNVYIGAGAKIIGNIHVGDGVRIGANCVVVNDVPANSIVYMSGSTIIQKEEKMDNTFSIECLTEKEKGI